MEIECFARFCDRLWTGVILIEQRQHLLARELGIDGKVSLGEVDHRICASAPVGRSHLEVIDFRRMEVLQQALLAFFAVLAALVG